MSDYQHALCQIDSKITDLHNMIETAISTHTERQKEHITNLTNDLKKQSELLTGIIENLRDIEDDRKDEAKLDIRRFLRADDMKELLDFKSYPKEGYDLFTVIANNKSCMVNINYDEAKGLILTFITYKPEPFVIIRYHFKEHIDDFIREYTYSKKILMDLIFKSPRLTTYLQVRYNQF
jgi:hypothetical protein